ncbi:hypothetical protein ACET3Z_032771 [Daucus carota]
MVRTKRSERIGRNPKAPRVQLYCGEAWFDVYDPPNKTLPADELNSLVVLAQLAIYHYNVNQGTNYENVKVLRAERLRSCYHKYNIVFEASLLHDNNAVEIFKAEVVNSNPGCRTMKWVEIKSVKINSLQSSDESDDQVF